MKNQSYYEKHSAYSSISVFVVLTFITLIKFSGCTPNTTPVDMGEEMQAYMDQTSESDSKTETDTRTEAEIDNHLDSTMPPAMPDNPEMDFESSPDLLVGKGAQEFISILDGEISTLHRGCQGAQHLWVSLRLPQHTPDTYSLELQLVDDQDQLLAPPFTLTEEVWLPYEDQDQAGSEIIGLTLVIFDPMNVVGDEALVKAKVTINDVVLESRVWVEVQWGADAC
ncbi:MAG: hypothetical protein CMH49_06980 [Myxococcales bacterium]|nr:hypothetical protein [Myxococcales bacterium]